MSTSLIQNFFNTWSPYAVQAGNALGVDPNVILGQWATESGYGTNSLSQGYNVGSISNNSYSSPASFTQSFINLVQSVYPGATNTGSNSAAYVNGLTNGINGASYLPQSSASTYANTIGQIASTNPAGSSLTPQQAGSDTTSILQSIWNWITNKSSGTFQIPGSAPGTIPGVSPNSPPVAGLSLLSGFVLRAGVGIIALMLFALGLAALALKTQPGQVVKRVASNVVRTTE